MKKGLILEGGAMRGMFTAGVIDVMMEHDIAFDGAIGVSAGAVFGCNYKSHQIGRSLRYNTKFCKDPRYASFRSLLTTEVLKILRQLAEQNMTMVIVTHEIDFARAVSDRVIFMADGYIVEQGPPEEVLDNPQNPRTQAFLRKVQR